jgi:hypothetical protein
MRASIDAAGGRHRVFSGRMASRTPRRGGLLHMAMRSGRSASTCWDEAVRDDAAMGTHSSASSSDTFRRRISATGSVGRIVRTSRAVLSADNPRGTPPGCSLVSCSWIRTRVFYRAETMCQRRWISNPSTCGVPSGTTSRSKRACRPAMAVRAGIVGVGLVPRAGQLADLGCQRGGYVTDLVAVVDQLPRQQPPQPVGVLVRPDPVWPALGPAEQPAGAENKACEGHGDAGRIAEPRA